jgi:hypothetical protein
MMDNNDPIQPILKWSRRCFWIAMCVFFPTYVVTRYINEDESWCPSSRLYDSLGPIPTHRVKWETHILTQAQVNQYLANEQLSPHQIKEDKSHPLTDLQGDYSLLFRLNANDSHVQGALVKCYVEGMEFPIECKVYPARNNQFKDHFIPIHVDPKKFKSPPNVQVRWRCIFR